MTDPTTDELLSRVLDDEATAEERAQVAADPVLAHRLGQLQEARARMAAPVPALDPSLVDQLVRSAVQAADGPAAPAVVIPFHRRPVGRTLLAAAAVLVVVALAVPVLRSLDAGRSTSTDQATSNSAEESSGLAAEADDGTGLSADLGSFDDLSTLAATLSGTLGEAEVTDSADAAAPSSAADESVPQTTVSPESQEFDGGADTGGGATSRTIAPGEDPLVACQEVLSSLDPAPTAPARAAAAVRWRGQAAVAYLFAAEDGTQQVVVLSADTCEALAGPSPA